MCIVPEQVKFPESNTIFSASNWDTKMTNSTVTFEAKISFSYLLELAADNDVEGFKQCIESNPNAIDEVGLWYGRQVGARGMVLEYRTPLMVAAMYGSLDVVKFILSLSELDVNRSCGPDKSTALHWAACGGSADAVDAVKLLLVGGADPGLADAKGNRPYDVINVSWKLPEVRAVLEDVLNRHGSAIDGLKVDSVSIPTLSESKSMSSGMEAPLSPLTSKKEYPVDPSLPDIKNSIYGTDEFRMYSFKVRPCSRAYSHDWTECPFVHPGENARRRDPRKYHYSCVPCPDFRKGSCRRGDMCEYAHGVFECWLHPAQYRTRLCKDGVSCSRRVCFFAHTHDELRPLYASTGSAVPSPRSMASAASVMDMATALNIFSGSPSPFTNPMSPSGGGISPSSCQWQQQNIPTLHLPGSNIQANNLQTSRLRSSLNARDIPFEEMCILQDLGRSKTLAPSNLDELFSAEISSPRYSSGVLNHMLSPINTKVFSPKSSFGLSSPGIMSPRGIESQSPLSARLSALTLRDKQQHMRSLSARDLGANLPRDLIPESGAMGGSPRASWSKWESSNGRPDWSVNDDELNRLKRSYTIGHNNNNNIHNNGEEPDLSWVQTLVKDSPPENKDVSGKKLSGEGGDGSNSNSQVETVDHSSLGAWLDQIAAQ